MFFKILPAPLPRQFVGEHDRLRHLVARQRPAQVFEQLGLGDGRVREQNHHGAPDLTPPFVGHTDDRAVGHRGMAVQHRLDLGR